MLQKFLRSAGVGSMLAAGFLVAAGVAYAAVPTFSQTNITVGLGQSVSVTSTNGVGVYMLSNSSPTVASIVTSGTQITITGQGLGSAMVNVCAVGTASECTNLSVTVQSGIVSGISFSQNSFSLTIGSNKSVTVSGGNGTYALSANSNASVASASLSGSTVTVSGLAAGSNTITVCDTSGSCGTLSVTVTTAASSSLSFSQNSLSLVVGSSQGVTISGGNGTYNVSNNSNTGVVTTGMAGNTVNIYTVAAGSATLNVCDTASVCGTINATVTAPAEANQSVKFSVSNPTLAVGQSLNVGLSGSGTNYFILTNVNSDIVKANMYDSVTLSLSGLKAGTGLLRICAAGGDCSPISVTVTEGATSAGTAASTANTTTGTQTTASAPVTQTVTPVQTGTAVTNTALLAQILTLKASILQVLTQMQSIQSQLNQLEAQVRAGGGGSTAVGVNSASSGSNFTELLDIGSQNADVTALQKRLTALGFYSGPITGFYGALTRQAVLKYQAAKGITATGSVGASTRAALNAGN